MSLDSAKYQVFSENPKSHHHGLVGQYETEKAAKDSVVFEMMAGATYIEVRRPDGSTDAWRKVTTGGE